MTLPDPTVWLGSRPPVVSFTAIRRVDGEAHPRLFTKSYSRLYAARVWLNTIVGNVGSTKLENELRLNDGTRIRSYELNRVLDYKLNDEESKWFIDEADLRMIARFRRGVWEIPETVVTQDVVKVTHKVRTPKQQRAALPQGYVTITDLCKNTPTLPTVARALLRASNFEKPSYGWAFGPTDLPAVRALIGLV